jgi:hypothetical protein
MKTLAANALALILATAAAPVLAQEATGGDMQTADETMPAASDSMDTGMGSASGSDMDSMQGNLIRTRDITGGTIYTLNQDDDTGWDPTNYYDQVGDNWDAIGEIEDLVLSRDGQVIGMVAEVGGFLDIGDKHVLIPLDNLNLVAVDDQDYAYVTRMTVEELKDKQDIDEGFWD